MTKEERRAAFENYRVEIVEDRIYAIVTVDVGRQPNEVRVVDWYQRLHSTTEAVQSYWHGSMLAADHARKKRGMSKEECLAAYKNYRIEIIEDRIYAVATLDFGTHVQDMYQRLNAPTDAVKRYWHGTTLAADHKHEKREVELKRFRESREGPFR